MLITGATGFIGSRLATLAMARGYAVKTLTRSDWTTLPAVPVDRRYFGSLPTQIPAEAMQGVDVVVHCAASVAGDEQTAYAVNVDGTIRLARLAQEAGVQTFIFLSSQSARPDALSAYGRTKYAAEQALQNLHGLNAIIVRPGLVTGPGSTGLFQRLSRAVESLPVLPLLGGGRAIVQPIHVDDLCAALFRCDESASELHRSVLHLGHFPGIPLAQFLHIVALARLGRRKRTLPVPLWPVELVVRAAEALHIPLPINSTNLKGMKSVERMQTDVDMARLGLTLRSLDETVRAEGVSDGQPLSLNERAVRVLLIGAGRIGLVHAVTLSRLHRAVLSGVVDTKAGATDFLRRMGLAAPAYQALDDAVAQARPDAAVIATPAATHLPLTRACLAYGLAVMVEKPLAIRREQLADYEQLAEEFPERPVQVGYVMPRNPQVTACLGRLHAGEFGKVLGFAGVTLLSFIQGTATKRWEANKDISGGGALINSGGHVLSMIRAAFSDPEVVEAQSFKRYSTGVEDSMVLTFTYPEFRGTHYCSWSIDGYPRQENMLTIWTEQGRLIMTGSVGVFMRHDGAVDVTHQLDFDVGFNMAPDYAGAGFTAELADLEKSVRTGRPAPMNMLEAIRLEHLLFKAYDVSREVHTFRDGQPAGKSLPPASLRLSGSAPVDPGPPSAVRRVLDLRDLSAAHVHTYLCSADRSAEWDEYLLAPGHMQGLSNYWRTDERLRVTVPDFLNQSRLLSLGRYTEVLRQMGAGGIGAAARTAMPLLMSERGASFWVAAMGLLGAGLRAVPAGFRGTLLLHSYLTDFALALRRLDMLEKLLKACRRMRPRARVGFHTNMAAEALNALHMLDTAVDEVSVLTSPRAVDMAATLGAMRRAGLHHERALTAEIGLAPAVVHRVGFQAPQCWAFGADAVLVGIGADPALAEQRRIEVEQAWTKVFPGLSLPEDVCL